MEGYSCACAPGTASPLPLACFRDPGGLQRGHACVGIEPLLLHTAGIDNAHDAVDRDGCLRDVGGQDDLVDALLGLKHAALLVRGDLTVQREDDVTTRAERGAAALEALLQRRDILPPGQEDERVSCNALLLHRSRLP